jgi:hypothetical protein
MTIHLISELPLIKPYLLGVLTGLLGSYLIRLTMKITSRRINPWTGIITMQGSCRDLTASIERSLFLAVYRSNSILRRVRSVVFGPNVIK